MVFHPASLELRIAFTVGRVTGSLGDAGGAAAAGSLVTLIPDESRRQKATFTSTLLPISMAHSPSIMFLLQAAENDFPSAQFVR
jgi:hypothetical protein